MASLRDIRKRLRSIENIQQLTKAMEMVAASRLHHAQIKIQQTRTYLSKIQEIMNNLTSAMSSFSHPLLQQRTTKKVGLVILSADMGLCGAFNKDLFVAANKFLNKYSPDQVELILIGSKAIDYYHRRKWPIRHQMLQNGDTITLHDIKTLTNELINGFLLEELDEVWIVYTHYINMMSRKVITEKFLNIEKPPKKEKTTTIDYIFEPDPAEIYKEALFRYCLARVHAYLDEAHLSELAARVFAMKTATHNADEMIEKLTLVRNKVRQAGITAEMLEITAGAER